MMRVSCSCGEKIGFLREKFDSEMVKRKETNSRSFVNLQGKEKSIAGQILDEMNVTKLCCRSMLLTDVRIE